jgi:hypothetical protein
MVTMVALALLRQLYPDRFIPQAWFLKIFYSLLITFAFMFILAVVDDIYEFYETTVTVIPEKEVLYETRMCMHESFVLLAAVAWAAALLLYNGVNIYAVLMSGVVAAGLTLLDFLTTIGDSLFDYRRHPEPENKWDEKKAQAGQERLQREDQTKRVKNLMLLNLTLMVSVMLAGCCAVLDVVLQLAPVQRLLGLHGEFNFMLTREMSNAFLMNFVAFLGYRQVLDWMMQNGRVAVNENAAE